MTRMLRPRHPRAAGTPWSSTRRQDCPGAGSQSRYLGIGSRGQGPESPACFRSRARSVPLRPAEIRSGRPINRAHGWKAEAPIRGKSKRPARGQQSFAVTDEDRLSSHPALSRKSAPTSRSTARSASDWTTAETVLDASIRRCSCSPRAAPTPSSGSWSMTELAGSPVLEAGPIALGLISAGDGREAWVDGVLARKKGFGF